MSNNILDLLNYKFIYIPLYAILIGLLFIIILFMLLNKPKSSSKENFANLDRTTNFMMFYTDWCPHCQHAKPEFKKVMKNLSNGKLNGHKLSVKMINAEENKDLANQYQVEGYPTIIFTKDGKNYTYEGNRTEKDMMSYLETMLRY